MIFYPYLKIQTVYKDMSRKRDDSDSEYNDDSSHDRRKCRYHSDYSDSYDEAPSHRQSPINQSRHHRKRSSSIRTQYKSKTKRQRSHPHNVPPIKTLDDMIKFAESHKDGIFYNVDGAEKLSAILSTLKNLQQMHGLESIKSTIVSHILYLVQHLNNNEDFLHTVICGAPGTGKTTVATIMGEIYAGLGFLEHGRVVKVNRADLIGQYIGHTAVQTERACRDAFGGVLLIDEFYSLANGRSKEDGFEKECLDTLTYCLSEFRDRFVCVVAGYEEDIEKYIWPVNQGLRRRFPWKYTIDAYSASDVVKIFETQVTRAKWEVSKEAQDVLQRAIDIKEITFTNFGGDTETLLTKCKMAYSNRQWGHSHDYTVSADDMKEAIAQFNGHLSKSKDKKWEEEIRWRIYN